VFSIVLFLVQGFAALPWLYVLTGRPLAQRLSLLGILAAVVTSSLVGLTATAKTNACAEELRTVQTAMDAMLAKNNITSVTAQASATNTFTALPVGTGTEPLSPNYLRQSTTKGSYTWTAAGLVSAAGTGGCA